MTRDQLAAVAATVRAVSGRDVRLQGNDPIDSERITRAIVAAGGTWREPIPVRLVDGWRTVYSAEVTIDGVTFTSQWSVACNLPVPA